MLVSRCYNAEDGNADTNRAYSVVMLSLTGYYDLLTCEGFVPMPSGNLIAAVAVVNATVDVIGAWFLLRRPQPSAAVWPAPIRQCERRRSSSYPQGHARG